MKKRQLRSLRSGSEISAFIGLGTDFKGQLTFEGVIRLDGHFSGEIRSSGTLIVGDTAVVQAEIDVDTVVISGEVRGNIRAKNRVEFHAPARHYGNIISPVVTIDEGVLFEGNCQMAEPPGATAYEKKVTLISQDGSNEAHQEII